MSKRWAWMTGLAVAAVTIGVTAEQSPGGEPHVRALSAMQWIGDGGDGGAGPTFVFAHSATASVDRKLVKGAPYSAEAVTEFVQTLADGNRITRKTTASLYRDSEGRTRREQNLGAVGALGGSGEARQQVLINDPVAKTHYVLNPKERTARKLPSVHVKPFDVQVSDDEGPDAGKKKVKVKVVTAQAEHPVLLEARKVEITRAGDDDGPMTVPPLIGLPGVEGMRFTERLDLPDGQSEPLGKQTIEGLEAEGTRTTVTIPAGKIGNEQPLQVVTERWYSPELQTVVMSRHSDPRFGDTTYRLTGITRAEPQKSLFELPADYQVKDGPPPGDVVIRKFEKRAKPGE